VRKLNTISIIGSILFIPIFLFASECNIIEKTITKNEKKFKIYEMNCFPIQTSNKMLDLKKGISSDYMIINEYATKTCSRASFHKSFLHKKDNKYGISGSNGYSSEFHTGNDIYALDINNYKSRKHIFNDKAQAVADATIYMLGKNKDYGNFLMLNHDDKYLTLYAHLKDIDIGIISKENFEKLPDDIYEIKNNSFSFSLNNENTTIDVPNIKGKTILGTVGNTSNYGSIDIHLHFVLRNFENTEGLIPSFTNRVENENCEYPIAKPIDTSLPIPTITSIKNCNSTDNTAYTNENLLELKPKFKPEKQCVKIEGTEFKKSNSIVWWRVNNNNEVKPIKSSLNVSDDGKSLTVNFGDYKPKDESYADNWEFIITNRYGKEDKKEYSVLKNSPHISFKVLPYSNSITCDNQNLKFYDIDNHKFEESILYIKNECIVKGYTPENCSSKTSCYKPNKPITRAEFIKIVLLAKFSITEIEKARNQGFEDVLNNDWFVDYVNFAKEKKFIIGYTEENKFKPNQFITFAEASKIIVNILIGEHEPEKVNDDWWIPFINKLKDDYVDKSKLQNAYASPNEHNLTRAEMAYIIHSVERREIK